MKVVVVGMMTYCVENKTAAEILEHAADATKAGDFEQAAKYKKMASRVESGAMSAEEWYAMQNAQAEHIAPPVPVTHVTPPPQLFV
jgi:hypothetical protein